MDIVFHYPPALVDLLIEVVPRLARSKIGQIDFYRGAGYSGDFDWMLLTHSKDWLSPEVR